MPERTAVEALLGLTGEDPSDGLLLGRKARALRLAVLGLLAGDLLYDGAWQFGVPLLGCFALGLRPRWMAAASALAFSVTLVLILVALPVVANHDFLKWILLLLFVGLRPDEPREQRLLLQAARWLLLLVLLWSGLKKLAFGTYFHGEYIAYMIATDARFADFFSLWLPAEEIARLVGYAGQPGTGPYRVPGPVLPLLSNLIWIGEIGVPLLLLWPPARGFAWILGLGLILGIEVVAREVFFGLLFTALLLAFAPGLTIERGSRWLLAAAAALVIGSYFGLRIPGLS